MDGAFQAEGQAADGEYGSDDKRGFRGTSENAKTKICMRYAFALHDCTTDHRSEAQADSACFYQMESRPLPFWR